MKDICDDVYRLKVARFEILRYATAALIVGHEKSLTKEEKGKVRDFSICGFDEMRNALQINKFKTVVQNFLYDSMNYVRNISSGRLSKLRSQCKRDVIRMTGQDYAYSSTIKFAQEVSIASKTARKDLTP